eukprot:TRINITY_DN2612_c0_g1_i1.p1 TRINITY_DN2612_c0_g1~~TRINITY_DN2612_c0_g1_i1.p1  ORF type:complete len:750 (-),score=103.66 TRINITY_DN2612_c0_g1_i1:66-2315(-)
MTNYLMLLLAAVFAPLADSTKALPLNTQALEASVLKLVRSRTNTKDVPSAIVSMKNLVAQFLMPHLKGMHDDDSDAMRTAGDGFNSCSTDHNHQSVSLRALSDAHKTCRANESQMKGAMDSSCGDQRDAATKRYIAECALFATRSGVPGELPSVCKKEAGSTNQHESWRIAEYYKNLRDGYVEWQTKCEASKAASEQQNRTCASNTIGYANKSAACDKAQIDLDSAACWQYRRGDCSAYTRCWTQATQSYIKLNSSIAAAAAARKLESSGLQKILCYLDVLNASQTNMQSNINAGIQACDAQNYDTSGFDIISLYYADRAPKIPAMPSCAGSAVWPKPGSAAYTAQEYDSLPEDAPARECQSVCCQWCSYFDCPNGVHFQNASCLKGNSMDACCDSVAWRPTSWVEPTCNSSCGLAALNATRDVPCQDPAGTAYPDSACGNFTKPATTKKKCPATSACAVCAAGTCNQTGTYLSDCGGFNTGTCTQCNVSVGSYATGIGGVNQDTCPTSPCSLRAVCPAGQYLEGCGGTSPGSCKACTDRCLQGSYSDGCTGMSAGSCKPCTVPSGYLAITAGSSTSARCDTVAETQAAPVSSSFTTVNLASFSLDKDANRHQATVSGAPLSWIRLTELCQRPDVTPGWMRYTMSTTTGKNYKVAVEASWWPVFGDGLKGSALCNHGGSSVLQLQVTGAGNEDPVGAKVTACFDQATHVNWSTVWFEFAPSSARVQLTFSESKFSCLSVKSVKIYEVDP